LAGVRVAAGSGALRDVSNPVGRGDPLEAAYLLASRHGLRPEEAYDAVSAAAYVVAGVGTAIAGAICLAITARLVVRERIVFGR